MSNITKQLAALDARIAKLNEQRAELVNQQALAIDPKNVSEGDSITAKYGRGETKEVVTGRVLAVITTVKGAVYFRILTGAGADTEIITVSLASTVGHVAVTQAA